MSYRCGVFEPLASMMGVDPGGPRLTCDGPDCTARVIVREGRRPPKWLLDGRAPKGWRNSKSADGTRYDWCPECRGRP